jgi:diketogulonate reductase-like aldo/keto reductase
VREPGTRTHRLVHLQGALRPGYRLIDAAAAYGYDETLHGFVKSAGKLGVDQIDLLILHQALPSAFDRTLEAYRALETLLADGRVRAFGVSNFMAEHLTRLLERATVVPAVNQTRSTPTSRSGTSRSSTPNTASSRRPGHRSAASRSTGTVATGAPSTTRSSATSPEPTARVRRR